MVMVQPLESPGDDFEATRKCTDGSTATQSETDIRILVNKHQNYTSTYERSYLRCALESALLCFIASSSSSRACLARVCSTQEGKNETTTYKASRFSSSHDFQSSTQQQRTAHLRVSRLNVGVHRPRNAQDHQDTKGGRYVLQQEAQ